VAAIDQNVDDFERPVLARIRVRRSLHVFEELLGLVLSGLRDELNDLLLSFLRVWRRGRVQNLLVDIWNSRRLTSILSWSSEQVHDVQKIKFILA